MSKIKEMYGTRPDGVRIDFEPEDIEKIAIEHFSSITVTEVMTEKEVLERFGKKP